MIFSGWMLWADGPNEDSQWTQGHWRIEGGRVYRLHETPHTVDYRGWAVPGLMDVHCHIGIGPNGAASESEQRIQLEQTVASGVLAFRDCGVPVDNSWIQRIKASPHLIRCGRHLARPKRYIRSLPIDVEDVKGLPERGVEQVHAGDGWVKLVGDWIDRSAGSQSDLSPLWPRSVMRDTVEAVHEAGGRVAVHAFSHAVIEDLLESGVDDIEHGSGIDREQAQEIARRGILVTPTLRQVELFHSFAEQAGSKYPVYARTMMDMYREREEHFAMLLDENVTVVMGTDSGGYQEHGTIAAEMELWVKYGANPRDVLDVATWKTRRAMGIASLSEGARADCVITDEDPSQSVEVIGGHKTVVLNGSVLHCDSLREQLRIRE